MNATQTFSLAFRLVLRDLAVGLVRNRDQPAYMAWYYMPTSERIPRVLLVLAWVLMTWKALVGIAVIAGECC
jgi:hypothetical protein